jgi:hypothetical protein
MRVDLALPVLDRLHPEKPALCFVTQLQHMYSRGYTLRV